MKKVYFNHFGVKTLALVDLSTKCTKEEGSDVFGLGSDDFMPHYWGTFLHNGVTASVMLSVETVESQL
jgi:hypothetical protein